MEDADAIAIERAKAGDSDGFRTLVQRHSRSVFRLAYRMTGNEFDAEDVVQETFLRAYKQLDNYESRSSFGTWIYRIASNYALDVIRSRQRHTAHHVTAVDGNGGDVLEHVKASDPGQDRVYYSAQIREKLDCALGDLSPQERTAFLLRHFEGKSIDEIGAVLSLGTSATKNSIFRAVRKVRDALEPVVSSI
jgi:RNA polymerase sigma-70 factor (ECF subfamily)